MPFSTSWASMPKKARTYRLEEDIITALEAEAARQHRSLNNLIEVALSEWLEARK